MKLKKLICSLLIALMAIPAMAQLENGKIYRFINKADVNIALEAASTTSIYGSGAGNGYSQLWLAETHPNNSNAWSLRSLGNGLYVSPRGQSTNWTFSAKPSTGTVLYLIDLGDGYYTFNTANNSGGATCMHYATSQGGAVVGWNTGAEATWWSIQEVQISEEELEANWNELDAFNGKLTDEYKAGCEAALANLFSDAACTTLKKSFANEAALEADADYQALPADLQAMTKKVFTGNWQEDNFDSNKPYWDSEHAKRFRVQSIEPHSIAGTITEWFGINAHINMDNPLGITGNYRQLVYIIIEGEIKDGAEVRLNSLVGHGLPATYDQGIVLNEGLNIVPFHANGNTLYINYVVHTYENNQFTNKLSDYADLKVHVAGGNVNGFYNGVGDAIWGEPDDDDDWQYYEDRTNTESATIVGKRQILHFCMNRTPYTDKNGAQLAENGMSHYLPNNIRVPAGTPAKQNVNTMLEAWDRIHLSELATMGLLSKEEMDSLNNIFPRYGQDWQKAGNIYDYTEEFYANQGGRDYSEYFNHKGVALGNFSGYMSGGWRNCNYHHNTMGSIIGEIAVAAGPTWGPAHEIGHQHQKVFTVNGLTEVTNNMHSNIAVWYMGMGTSRVNGTEGNLDHVYTQYKRGNHFLFHAHDNGSQNLWSQTQMYYRLWMYYHLTGHRTDFYPRLFELNRADRMSNNALGNIGGIGHTSGTESMLKYYKQACQAAEEDLTEFFRAHGFFVLMDQKLRGDYANSYFTQTQEEVDAAIAWVKEQGWPENLAPLFINDCCPTASYSHDGKTRRSYWDPGETGGGRNATIGMYNQFWDDSKKAEGYLYTVYNGKITIMTENASGAVGFIAYDDNNELVAFTSNYSVTLPADVVKFKIYAVQADGTKVEVISAAEGGTEEQQLDALKKALAASRTLTGRSGNNKFASYFKASAVAELTEMTAKAQNAYDNKDQSEYSYGAWAMALNNTINEIKANQDSYVGVKELNYYELQNAENNFGYVLGFYNNSVKAASTGQLPIKNDNRRWEFVESEDEKDVYYLKNVGQNLYIAELEYGGNAILTSPIPAVKFTIIYNGDGTASVVKYGENSTALFRNTSNDIIGQDMGSTRSQWRIVLHTDNASEFEKEMLGVLLQEAARILEETSDHEYLDYCGVSDIELNNLARILAEAKADAEANMATADDLAPYIDALDAAMYNIDAAYVLKPRTSTEGEVYWYRIRDIETDNYCYVNPEGTGSYVDAIAVGEFEEDNGNDLWGFIADGKGGYEVFNAGYEAYIYTGTGAGPLKADKAKDAGSYIFNVDSEHKALTIEQDGKYWANINEKARIYRDNISYWRIEFAGKGSNLTNIVEVETEATTPVIKGIFDLTGRRIEEITEPGIYIINGKKVLVK